MFKKKDAKVTGIDFSNDITESDSVNVLDYYYSYNGGGVGVGDFNNDGRQDLFFAGNMVSSRLYMNEGKLHFKDITESSGTTTKNWIMGVSLVDINHDGWLDIYLNVVGVGQHRKFRNLLFINQGLNAQGIPTFSEQANKYGLADGSYSVQSAFLDFDRDGDLDMFLMTNGIDFTDKTFVFPKSYPVTGGKTIDKLYENIGTPDSLDHPYYVDVSKKTGIQFEDYGLGLGINDLNGDGWPDIYVASDFMPNDLIYINQQDGTFKESAELMQSHQTRNGMGVDIADLNNDLRPDIIVLDMLPETNARKKTMIAGMDYNKFQKELDAGYVPQFLRNTVQLNRGTDTKGITHFSDISQLTGMDDTDWSWAPLMADFDNDGFKDVYVTNGFVKDITDLDFMRDKTVATAFGSQRIKKARKKEMFQKLNGIKVSNFLFKNNGRLSFSNATKEWGLDDPSFSNGAIYADLDNDGDLDLVTNNINEKAFVFENRSDTRQKKHHYLTVKLRGREKNPGGIGGRINIYTSDGQQTRYVNPVRGYLSSINAPAHFGLGSKKVVDSLEINWSDGKRQVFRDVDADQQVDVHYSDTRDFVNKGKDQKKPVFTTANNSASIHYKQEENPFVDFQRRPLLTRMYSRNGPGIAVADVDHKNGLDFFIGGSAHHSGMIFKQSKDGTFRKQSMNNSDADFEDMGALFFDVDNDGDQDLYVVSGGSVFPAGTRRYLDRLYLNNGNGSFEKSSEGLPSVQSSGSCVTGADFDRDGDIDLFVGGRYQPGSYPNAPGSYLLENENGKLKDVTESKAEGLSSAGMVSSAIWTDFNNDGWMDLMLVGEWMPVTFYKNERGHLVDITQQIGLKNSTGWWDSIYPVDIDNDGDMDYILGNMGLNNEFDVSAQHPVKLYADDFDGNGILDPVTAYYSLNEDHKIELFPYAGRDDMFRQLSVLKRKFKTYKAYGSASLAEVISPELMSEAKKLSAGNFKSCILENLGSEKFDLKPLPVEAQFSTVNGILSRDYNNDGNPDLLLAGNQYATEITYGWQDASLGLLLWGDGNGNFKPVSPQQSGLFLDKDIRGLASFPDNRNQELILAAANSDSLKVLTQKTGKQKQVIFAKPNDAYAIITLGSGQKRKKEFMYGSGYLSQSARYIVVNQHMRFVEMVDYQGNSRRIELSNLTVKN